MSDGVSTKLCKGIAALLGTAGAATWTPSGVVSPTASPPPVFLGIYPDQPDIAVALSTYSAGGDDPTLAGSVLMLQVRTRSSIQDVTSADALDDAIGQVLMGNFPLVLPSGVRITSLVRRSGVPMGRDASGRMERTTNYQVRLYDPGPHRG